jgi:DNA-binding response OmpR family regulator
MKRKRVLVVEDDREIVDLLTLHLADQGFEVSSAATGDAAVELATSGSYALIVLDLMLPGLDGIEVCRRVREESAYTPILMLTAKSEELDKVLGLEVGADDYVTKPFSLRELMARVRALTRRTERLGASQGGGGGSGSIEYGELKIDLSKRRVTLEGDLLDLTPKEYELLELLSRHPEQAFSRNQLLEQVWGYRYEGYSHTVNSHINRLRAKLERNPSEPKYIQTVWGFGYRFGPVEEGD